MAGDGVSDEGPVPGTLLHEVPSNEAPGAVLFACTMNVVRSPMAAAILRHLAGRGVYVASAGVRPGDEIDPFATAVMD